MTDPREPLSERNPASNAAANGDTARVGIPPPLIALALIGAGIGLHRAFPEPILPSRGPALAIGLPVLALGIILNIAAIRTLRRAGTDLTFRKPASRIVKRGPYGWSRNPIYLSGLLQFTGLAFIVNTLWLLAMLPLLILYFRLWVIAREERYLERRFGEEYRAYRSSVRRWIQRR